jgi:hypothetical protein
MQPETSMGGCVMRFLAVKNFEEYQHYSDRTPPWIKLYNSLLDDYAFLRLSETGQIHLVKLWLLASRHDNRIPNDIAYINGKLFPKSAIDIQELIDAGFIYVTETQARKKAKRKARKERSDKGLQRKQDASRTLATSKQNACLEGEGEGEGETEEREKIKSISPEPSKNWVTEGSAWWRVNVGSVTEKQFGGTLVDLVRTHGWPAVFAGAKEYADHKNGRDKRLDWFAKDAVRWIKTAGEPLVDDGGELTAKGKRIMGIAS